MKKHILFSLLVLTAPFSFCQSFIDVEILEISSPAQSVTTIIPNSVISINFLTHVNVSSIQASDILAFSINLDGVATEFLTVTNLNSTSASSGNYYLQTPIQLLTSNIDSGQVSLCLKFEGFMDNFNTLIPDADTTNNITCRVFNTPLGTIEISPTFHQLFYSNKHLQYQFQAERVSSITLLNITGQIIHQEQVQNTKGQIDLSHIPDGVYVVKAQAGHQVVTKKISKF